MGSSLSLMNENMPLLNQKSMKKATSSPNQFTANWT